MKAFEIRRQLLYCGYNDVTDYLKNSPLNRYIYKQLIVLLPNHMIEVPIVTIFNEVYYVCVSARFDSKPGVDVAKRYMPSVEASLDNSLPGAQLVFCIVWILFKLKEKLTFNEECFIERLSPYITKSDFYEDTKRMLAALENMDVKVPDVFPTMTCSIDELPLHSLDEEKPSEGFKRFLRTIIVDDDIDLGLRSEVEVWWKITDSFSHSTIESLVRLFSKPEDQVRFVEGIRWACAHGPKKNRKKTNEYLEDLRDKIILARLSDNNDPTTELHQETFTDYDDGVDGDLLLGMAREKFFQEHPEAEDDEMLESPKEIADHLEYECNRLRKLNSDLQAKYTNEINELHKRFEAKMAEREIVYRAEMEAMRKDLLDKSEADDSIHNNQLSKLTEQQPKGFSLTVAEMVEYVKEAFSEAAANQFINMYYHFAVHKYNNLEEATLMDDIIKAVHKRMALHQTFDMPNVQQLNVNPKEVINQMKDEKKT